MKTKNNLTFLALTLVCGICAGVLRLQLLHNGMDEKGLLPNGSPYAIALWVLSIAYLAVVLFLVRKLEKGGTFSDNFPASKLRGGLCVLGGMMLLFESGTQLAAQPLAGILGVLAGLSMFIAGLCRFVGKHPNPVFHIIVCIFYVIRLILSFRGWSADPQLEDYALQLMACVCLMLFAMHRASCDAEIINRRRTAFFGLTAVYFCLASLSDEAMPLLYCASALWAVGASGTFEFLPTEE